MTNHDCQKHHLKPFEDGEVCMICGNFYAPPLPEDAPVAKVMKKAASAVKGEATLRAKECKTGRKKGTYGASKRKVFEPKSVVELGEQYIREVFDQVHTMVQEGVPWNRINWYFTPRAFLTNKDVFKRYYRDEAKRRERLDLDAA
jgi:hypothetical protein